MDAAAKKIMDRIGAGKYDPVYVLQGEETYYIDLISNYIEANALSESDKGFNQVVLYGQGRYCGNYLNSCQAISNDG